MALFHRANFAIFNFAQKFPSGCSLNFKAMALFCIKRLYVYSSKWPYTGGGGGGGWVGRVLLDICLEWVILFLKFSFSSWNQKQYLQEGKGFLPASRTALFIPIIETIINLRCKSPVRPCNDFRLNSGQVNNASNRKNIFVWKQWPITEKKYTKHNYPISDQNHQNPLSLHKDILPSLRVKSYHTLAPLF